MKLISLHIIFIFVLGFQLNAQTNLVPNYSFEEKDSCGNGRRGVDILCQDWFTPMLYLDPAFNPHIPNNYGSSDYFNKCNDNNTNVPKNSFGYQNAKLGIAYSGIGLLTINHPPNYPYHNVKEYIEVILQSKLLKDRKYCVEFYYSLADDYFNYHSISIGALITDTLVKRTPHQLFWFTEIRANAQISDSLPSTTNITNWIKVSGSFIAKGGEQYLTIGNFQNTDNIYNSFHYVYIDDVKLWYCDSGDTTSPILPRELKVYPVPSLNNKITVEYVNGSLGGMQFYLYNSLGQMVYKHHFASGISKQELSLIHLASGVYFYSLGSSEAVYEQGKIILLE